MFNGRPVDVEPRAFFCGSPTASKTLRKADPASSKAPASTTTRKTAENKTDKVTKMWNAAKKGTPSKHGLRTFK